MDGGAKHPTWGTTKGLCKARLPSPQAELLYPPLGAVGHGDTWKVRIKRLLSRGWRGAESKSPCFLELLKNKYLEANMCLVWSGIVFN